VDHAYIVTSFLVLIYGNVMMTCCCWGS